MPLDPSTAPELSNNQLDAPGELVIANTDATDEDLTEDELLAKIDGLLDELGSGKFFTYIPPRPIGPENLNINPTKFPLVDPNKPPERIIYL